MRNNKHILLVEDNDTDAFIVNAMIRLVCNDCDITRVVNGKEAKEYLENANNSRPGLILLDLNLPIMTGKEFLQETAKTLQAEHMPVVILSSSILDEDRSMCKDFNVQKYFEKPIDEAKSIEIMQYIQ